MSMSISIYSIYTHTVYALCIFLTRMGKDKKDWM